MALSDQLAKLSAQAKSLEDAAAAVSSKNRAWLAQREAEVRAALDETQSATKAAVQETKDDVAAGWHDLQQSVSDGVASIKNKADKRRTEHKAKRADRAADNAEIDAEDAIAFAVYSLEEAEYYVLAAAQARIDADEAELEAAAKSTE